MTAEDTGTYTEECVDEAADVLIETAWDGPPESVKAPRAQLLRIFDLDISGVNTAAADSQQPKQIGSKQADENASYQALINDGSRL